MIIAALSNGAAIAYKNYRWFFFRRDSLENKLDQKASF